MGRSRAKRGKTAAPIAESAVVPSIPSNHNEVSPPIPDITDLDVVFGSIGHMPRYETVPSEFRRSGGPYAEFISQWFFRGLQESDVARLNPRPGVDPKKALRAIAAILRSFAPKHEHKEAGCAFLLHAWFEMVSP